ncbi:MAG: Daunorubicin/doxorubicin resistance ATP-binding protein DrrA [Planctomycetes bacterium]|nr:Daunorubicin/doxorubicin resistance ATP-binding protein DrrA [Planctomycetota bacterium]
MNDTNPSAGGTPAIEIQGLTKMYRGVVALQDLDLRIEAGSAFGFIGPNGAGKSTTIKILATLIRPTGGHAAVCGVSVTRHAERVKPLVGYMPDVLGVYDDMLVVEYLEFFAAAYRIRGEARARKIDEVLELTDLVQKREQPVKGLSRGMGQRLGLARCLLHDPQVLLLDEPAAGLDPRARIEFKELVHQLRRQGKTLVISSHILSEIGEMCDTIGIIERGKLLFAGSIGEAKRRLGAQQGRVFRIRVAEEGEDRRNANAVMEQFRGHPDVAAMKEGGPGEVLVKLRDGAADPSFLSRDVVRTGLSLLHFSETEFSLEDVFLHVTKGQVA